MKTRIGHSGVCVGALVVLLGIASRTPASETAALTPSATVASWLDQTAPVNWNAAGEAVPAAVREASPPVDPRCATGFRPPSRSRADRAVVKAGWTLVGPLQVFGETELVTAASGADGMCRPLGYQAFVFRSGRFLGTLSPQPMAARTDGVANEIRLLAADRLHVEYARYGAQDPLCCPSATTSVAFEIRGSGKIAVVAPISASTHTVAAPAVGGPATAPGRSLVNTYWKLTELGDSKAFATEGRREPHLILRTDGHTVAGSGGCNSLHGSYEWEGARLSFGLLATTKMMCSETMEQERAFLATLAGIRGWRVDGDRLELLDGSGAVAARFVAVDLE